MICTTFYTLDVATFLLHLQTTLLQILSMTFPSGMSGWSISENGKLKQPKCHLQKEKKLCSLSLCSLVGYQTLIHLSIH